MEKNVPADFGAGVSEPAIYPSACVDHPALVTGNVVPGQFDYRICKALKNEDSSLKYFRENNFILQETPVVNK
jgi:hypothetical protein